MGVTGISAARIREGVRHLSRLVRGDLSPSSRRIEDEAVAPLRGKALRRAMAGASLVYSTVYGAPCTLEINADGNLAGNAGYAGRSEEHTSELQSLMRNSYAVFCLQKKKRKNNT